MLARGILMLSLAFAFAAGTGGAALPPSFQKAEKAPVKDDPKIPALLKDLAGVVKERKGERDEEGIRLLDDLADRFPKLNPKQRKLVLKGVAKVLSARRKPTKVGLLLAASEALSGFGEDGAKALAKVVKDRRFRDKEWMLFRAQVVRHLGKPASDAQVKLLLELALRDRFDQVRVAAGEALGHYAKKKEKLRKEIAGKLIKEMSAIYNQSRANLDPVDQTRKIYEDRYAAIQDSWMRTLAKLTGQSFREPLLWERWFNNNKKKRWDKHGWGGPGPGVRKKKSKG